MNEECQEAIDRMIQIDQVFDSSYGDVVCSECQQKVTDHYMLKDEVWLSIAGKKDCLHLRCVEKRLDRFLTPDDFRDLPMNSALIHAYQALRTY